MSSAIPRPRSIRSSKGCTGSIWAGTNTIGSPSAWTLHRQHGECDFREGSRLSRFHAARHRREAEKARASRAPGFQSGHARTVARRKRPPRRRRRAVRAALSRAARSRRAVVSFTIWSTASSRKPPPISRTSRCCAATACRRITWPPAPMTPICASATSSAARII